MATLIIRYALAALIVAIVILLATGNLFSPSPVVIALQIAALAIAIWARASFPAGGFRVAGDPAADEVVRRGPYRLIRHPMYAAALLFVWTSIVAHVSPLTLSVGIVLTVIVAVRIVLEERLLRERYPEYSVYARSTKAVVPYIL